jgi:hypothetical protein
MEKGGYVYFMEVQRKVRVLCLPKWRGVVRLIVQFLNLCTATYSNARRQVLEECMKYCIHRLFWHVSKMYYKFFQKI